MSGAYAALLSLIQTIDTIQNHTRHSFSFDENQIGSLLVNARFFLEFVESNSYRGKSEKVKYLEIQIACAARLAEDVLESGAVDQIEAGSTLDRGENNPGSGYSSDLEEILQDIMHPVKQEVENVVKESRVEDDETTDFTAVASSSSSSLTVAKESRVEDEETTDTTDFTAAASSSRSSLTVAKESRVEDEETTNFTAAASSSRSSLTIAKESRVEEKESTDFTAAASSSRSFLIRGLSPLEFAVAAGHTELVRLLISQQSSRNIVPIVGMGGIGKTTLARHVYDKPFIKQHFDSCSWATVSQEHDPKEILSQLLSRDAESSRDDIHELGEQLHKKLWGRRYLIVLDDIWSMEAWDEIKNYFPDNGNGSRIVITTRLSNVANNLSSSSIAMDVLDEDTSWKLFCASTFLDEECPSELVEIGRKIVKRCGGLPLAIVTLARLLKRSPRTEKRWGEVAQDMISYLNSGEEQFMSIFSLSYNHLPAHLKPCFLYLGNFPQGKEILVSTLVRSWIAEGFIRGDGSKTLEEIGEGYLRDLVDRNLISVEEKGWNGRLSTCRIHDLLRDVCLKVGEEEKFFCVSKHPAAASRCRSESCLICSTRRSSKYKDESRLLRILPKAEVELDEDAFDPDCLVPVFNHLNMRQSFCPLYWERSQESLPLDRRRTAPQIRSRLPYIRLPSLLFLLWNLQTLVIHGVFARILAPVEIWEMPQLRHVDVFDTISIPDPPRFDPTSSVVMQNLQTLLVVENLKLTEEVCRRIPNIKELQMYYTLDSSSSSSSSSGYSQQNLNRFHKLQSLRCEFEEGSNWRDFALDFTFPHSLKEMWLGGSGLHWEDLSMIGSLPHLEALTLSCKNAVRGNEWNPVEGEFQRLKSLAIYHCEDLVSWNVESSHFPLLESLTIGHADELVEFPSEVGDIPTLSRGYLDRCSVSAAVSAMKMLKEQEEMGNDELVLEIQFKDKEELERVREIVQEEGLECSNLILNYFSIYE